MNLKEKKDLVKEIKYWWHSINLGEGIVTPGITSQQIQRIRMSPVPKDLKGKTVLDIGAWDGYYSFECEKRGAKVTAIDNNQHKKGHNGFYTAKKILNSRVKFYEMDLFDLPHKIKSKFDIVLFFGVLYHVKNPLMALEIIPSKTKELLILESHYIKTNVEYPLMRFYPGKELNNDTTNWWGPNIQCILDMLKVVGFKKVKVYKKVLYKKNIGRVIIKAFK